MFPRHLLHTVCKCQRNNNSQVSGTAAAAKEIEVMNISRSGSPCSSPITNTKAAAAKAIIPDSFCLADSIGPVEGVFA